MNTNMLPIAEAVIAHSQGETSLGAQSQEFDGAPYNLVKLLSGMVGDQVRRWKRSKSVKVIHMSRCKRLRVTFYTKLLLLLPPILLLTP